MAPALHLLLLLAGLLCAARGLSLIHSPDFNCSQPGIRCRVLSSTGLDWLRSYTWTPHAPSKLQVTAGIGKNDRGDLVPVLQINWTVSVDSSIRMLQGAEISVMEFGTGSREYVQFRFGNEFPRQRDQYNLPWTFFYNRFEVNPGNEYLISIHHLPKEKENYKEQKFSTPGCGDSDLMMQTDTCCRQGHCWSPNITLDFSGDKLIVTFTPRRGALQYGVSVTIRPLKSRPLFERLDLPEGATTGRRQVVFSNPIPYEHCWYNVSVWPYMEDCKTDCVRQWYSPACPSTPPPTPQGPSRRNYLWPIAAVVSIVVFTVIMTLLFLDVSIRSSSGHKPPPPPVLPPIVKQKVLLVYSADHRRYVDVVIRLTDFLLAWGLDVVLDRHHRQEISIKGVMPWLSYQKDQIEKTNGTILILCSKGAQAKWKARQNREAARVTLPEDTGYVSGDLFTSALNFIIPDFQKAKPYDRYVVAYFDELCDVRDIPSLFEICPRYAVTENLQNILFRIQRIERHRPNVQYNVDLEGNPSYRHLVHAVNHCQVWQKEHPDWFEVQCSPAHAEEDNESIGMQDEFGQDEADLTRRVYVQIRHPDASIAKQTPCVITPDPIRTVSPSLADGPSSVCVAPLLNEEHASVAMLQPSLNTEALRSYRQQPFLANVDESCAIRNERLHPIDLSSPGEQSVPSEALCEAQMRLFCQSILENQPINPKEVFSAVESSQDPREAGLVDQWVQSEDLGEAQMRLFRQNILENQPINLDEVNCVAGSSQDPISAGLVDHWVQSEDLGDVQMRLFCQNILENQDLNPGKVYCVAESSQDPRAAGLADQEESRLIVNDLSLSDQGVQSMMEAQNILGHPEAPSMVFGGESLFCSQGSFLKDDESIYECLLQMDSSTGPVQMNNLVEAQQKLFYQTILADQNLAPGMVFHTEPPPCRPLLVEAGIPLLPHSEPELQIDLSRHIGKGSRSMDPRETQKNWFNVFGGQHIIPETDIPINELNTYTEHNELNLGFGVMGRTDQMHCHSEDLGYGTLNPNNLEALKAE